MLRRYVGRDVLAPGEQLDGDAIWRKGRQLYWADEDGNVSYDHGLLLDQGFKAAIELGILPPETRVKRCIGGWARIADQLTHAPLVQAHNVHRGWFKADPSNGQIDEGYEALDGEGGHATMLVELLEQGGTYYALSQNSWGESYGYGGYYLMSTEHWVEIQLDDPMFASLPSGWEAWDGWRKYVITVTDRG